MASVGGAGHRLSELRGWLESLGAVGPLAFVLLYAAATVAALPGSALSIAGGALFGPWVGGAAVAAGATAGATLSFVIARYVARDSATRWLSAHERLRRLDELTERHGALMVAITRLVPLFPFNLLNYGFGLTRVRLTTYVGWSALCMLPGIVLYVVGASAVAELAVSGDVPWVAVGVVVAVGVALALAGRKLRSRLDEDHR